MEWLSSFLLYLEFAWGDLLELAIEHAIIVAEAIVIATVIGVALGVLTYRTNRPRELVLAVTGTFLTIPSLALFPLFIPIFGLGTMSVLVGLVMYVLLPIVRNTIVGLREVDPAVVESAQGCWPPRPLDGGTKGYRNADKARIMIAWRWRWMSSRSRPTSRCSSRTSSSPSTWWLPYFSSSGRWERSCTWWRRGPGSWPRGCSAT